jgi:HEAT repeat protein
MADSLSVRRAAAQALGRIGPAARSADRLLLETLFDGESGLRSDAAWALVRIAPPLKAALPLLIGRLTAEESRAVQQGLLRLLGNIGPTAQPALALIYSKCDDPALFPAALYALRSIAPDDPLLLRVLYEQLIGAQAPFRALAAETVGKLRLNSPRWIAALRTATGSSDAQVRHAARTALARMRPFT